MELINLTPHPLTIRDADDNVDREIPKSGREARLREDPAPDGQVDGIPAYHVGYGEVAVVEDRGEDGPKVTKLPDPAEGVIYIVPLLTALALKDSGRTDVVYPYEQTRDDNGTITGCRALARVV